MKFYNKKSSIPAQIGAMKKNYPQFKFKIEREEIIFKGEIQVKPEFPVYTLSIRYRGNKAPIVKVIKPKLVEKPPHFYKETKSLCLYHPHNFYWNSSKLIANEIMDWAIAWVYFYEVWLDTGIWYAPEVPHSLNVKK